MSLAPAVGFWKARAIRVLFALHRWLGVALGLLMLLWCVSGVVMIFVPYPSMSEHGRNLQREGLAPIHLQAALVLPELPDDAPVEAARIETRAGQPILRLATAEGAGQHDLASGAKLAPVDAEGALAVARTYAQRHAIEGRPELKQVSERDEFSVGIRGGPFFQVRLNDRASTMLYIDARGDVRQQTTSASRFWSWLGAIPHWLYFTELRRDPKLWTSVIVWTSLAGSFLAALGLFVGVRQLRRRKSSGRLASPYRGAKFWHHMLGLVFGVLALTWVFSGFASMNPFGWLNSRPETEAAAGRYAGDPPKWPAVREALAREAAAVGDNRGDIVQLSLVIIEGRAHIQRTARDGSSQLIAPDGAPARFGEPARQHAAQLLAGEGARIEELTSEDAFYYGEGTRFPVLRITTAAKPETHFYLDPQSGRYLGSADPEEQGFRWWHMALHTLDFAGPLRAEPAHAIVSILLMAGVTALCGLGAWIGIAKLARGGRLDNQAKD
jgi:uncharacterized iron-regulated membrane protein